MTQAEPELRQLLKRTTSRCPVCHVLCPGEVWRSADNKVFMVRECVEHGRVSSCLSSDARFYWLRNTPAEGAAGCGCNSKSGNAYCAADASPVGTLGRNALTQAGSPKELCTCIALIEVVNSCNLACPVCFTGSKPASDRVEAVALAEVRRRIEGVLAQKKKLEVLQLSGGEPTLHPEFFELMAWLQAERRIEYILLNTNGVRLAREPDFALRLSKLFPCERVQIYLQFDGVQAEGQTRLRGADLREVRKQAVENCAAANLPVTLAMTVIPDNVRFVWEAVEFGLSYSCVHGVVLQPMFGSGRAPSALGAERVNTADMILAAIEKSGGRLRAKDFTPLPCGDPNCCTLGYLLRLNGKTRSFRDFLDFTRMKQYLTDKVRFTLKDLAQCGCECADLGGMLKGADLKESMGFRIVIKPFMDAWSWDQERIDRCCTHVIRPDGQLDSFCRYYSGFPDTKAAL